MLTSKVRREGWRAGLLLLIAGCSQLDAPGLPPRRPWAVGPAPVMAIAPGPGPSRAEITVPVLPARPAERSVRAVAAAPGFEDGVRLSALSPPVPLARPVNDVAC